MPLFRFHRSSLSESLMTTIVVKDRYDLMRIIGTSELITNQNWQPKIKIAPYPSKDHYFDERIGWFTHIVSCNLSEKDKLHPVGFLSESLNGQNSFLDGFEDGVDLVLSVIGNSKHTMDKYYEIKEEIEKEIELFMRNS